MRPPSAPRCLHRPSLARALTCSVTLGLALIFPGPSLPSEIGVQPLVFLFIPFLGLCIQ